MNLIVVERVRSILDEFCQLFSSCYQRYALHRNDDGHFAQLIFAADLIRTFRSRDHFQKIIEKNLISFEEKCGTLVKTLTFFLRDALDRRNLVDRRDFFSELRQNLIELKNNDEQFEKIDKFPTENLVVEILRTLPKEIFDRKQIYERLLIELVEKNFDRLDDYSTFQRQLSFVTLGTSIDQSTLIDGILVPVANVDKLLPSFQVKTDLTLVFLDLSSNESSTFEIIDDDQRFFSFDTTIYRKFISKHLKNVDLIISTSFINSTFLFELHRAEINVIDTLDEKTFEFLLRVYRCLPVDRLILFEDESIDRRTTILRDGNVRLDDQTFIFLSSNDQHQTLLTSVPTSTLIFTTEKILSNLLRLIKFVREQMKIDSTLKIASEIEYLRYVDRNAVGWRNFLFSRRIFLDRHSKTTSQIRLPVCLYREYLLDGIDFLEFISKLDYIKLQQQKPLTGATPP